MIYTKKANFPYPLLINNTDDYKNANFDFDVELKENADEYIFEIQYNISSDFIIDMLKNKKARIILIIKARDNQFHVISDMNNAVVHVKKSRLSLDSRTVLQLMLQARIDIGFKDNNDINCFYDEYKDNIVVNAGMALGFSNTILFDGSQNKPFDLFEKRVDSSIISDIEIELNSETIVIVYKNEDMQFRDISFSRDLNNPYIYMGLQKAIMKFIINNSATPDEGVKLDDIVEDL
ncbi:hypothetical protein SAMN02745248_00492 [Hathewaya proteolytica DSM 3090]|uniref:Uncharacterized protein n=1 Tax=Hathewaya proteolytica DSM 3090 TaxID=1121331 RepID=A0A1M6KJD0_9CLOT|nr:hypothetical protein [Hathewaya proteolytica]SHJ59078.1 hypothetical protein SAMN02745248_00492 [Hathewaya proteolytica DSM 3090]